jgi:hypothetical protein
MLEMRAVLAKEQILEALMAMGCGFTTAKSFEWVRYDARF